VNAGGQPRSEAPRAAGEILPEACVFTTHGTSEFRVHTWVWTESLRFSGADATFAVDENIGAGANGTLIGLFRRETAGAVLYGSAKTNWALLRIAMNGDGTKLTPRRVSEPER
jgi:hypothetical protein